MKLIFIRHAEPDYSIDSLTTKGFREAKLLANRTKDWKVTQFYASPLGRAQATAMPTLEAHHVTLTDVFPCEAPDIIRPLDSTKAIVYPWLRELHTKLPDGHHPIATKNNAWDFPSEYLKENPILFNNAHWSENILMQEGHFLEQYNWVCGGLDRLLAQHGYMRDGICYKTDGTKPASNHFMKYDDTTIKCLEAADPDEPVLVFFCHLAVSMAMISHLINVSPQAMLHGFFAPPASITVLSAEEYFPGFAHFRIQVLGDTSHLRQGNEPVSYYGGFAAPFQM